MRHNSSRRPKNNRGNGGNNGGNNGGHNNGGNRRGSNVPPRMQVFDSNGPDVRIRGTAWQVHEKYLALAKDATSSGDSIMAENYLQHAEHYQRIINTFTEQMGHWAPPVSNTDQVMDLDADIDDTMDLSVEGGNEHQPQQQHAQQRSSQSQAASNAPSNAASNAPSNERPARRPRVRREREPLPADSDEDLGLPASMLKPSGLDKVTESA